jgi:dUTP pyrophosphatase
MKRVAQFFKVSRQQYQKDLKELFPDMEQEEMDAAYDGIRLPVRATSGSAGYDIYTPLAYTLEPGQSAKIPTGLRIQIQEGWFLAVFPRSGLGFKYRLQMDNTVGIIDSDYFGADNEGHLFVKITNDSREGRTLVLEPGSAFCQGIFLEYGICMEDRAEGIRTGGLGSTS